MTKDIRIRLSHILDCIEWIEEDAQDTTVERLSTDRRLKQLIERNLEIISEASRRIPDEMKLQYPDIPWRDVAGIGNVLRHNYEDIAPKVMLDLIRFDLPKLEKAIRAMLASLSKGT